MCHDTGFVPVTRSTKLSERPAVQVRSCRQANVRCPDFQSHPFSGFRQRTGDSFGGRVFSSKTDCILVAPIHPVFP